MPQPHINTNNDTANVTNENTTPNCRVSPIHYQHFPEWYLPYWMEWLEHDCIHDKHNDRSKQQVELIHHTTNKE